MTIDTINFYFMTPMEQYEHLRTNIKNFAEEIMKEHELEKMECNRWVMLKFARVLTVYPKQEHWRMIC